MLNENKGIKHIGNDVTNTFKRLEFLKNSGISEDPAISQEQAQKMYATVYHGLTKYFGLSPVETLLAATVISLSQKEGYAYASHKTYSFLLNVAPATVNTAFKRLRKIEVLEKCGNSSLRTVKWRPTARATHQLEYFQEKIKKSRFKK